MQNIENYDAEAKARMKWINYKGHEILLDDYTNIMPNQFAPLVERITNLTLQSGKKDILLIVDVTGAYANKEAVNAFVESAKFSRTLLKKTAILGITGVKKIFLHVVNKFSNVGGKPFNTIEEAKELLKNSELIRKLLEPPKRPPITFVGIRALEWRLLELSEIPFTNTSCR